MDRSVLADDTSSLLDLPDDVLLAVLDFLEPRELFLCRVVCRRLRDVCLHPDLWRSVQLYASEVHYVWRAALRLAPCLGLLLIVHHGAMEVVADEVTDEVASTSCVIMGLDLEVHDQATVDFATAIIEMAAQLGGLSSLSVSIIPRSIYDPDVEDQTADLRLETLSRAVYAVKDLHHLHLHSARHVNVTEFRFEVVSGDEEGRTASLTNLRYRGVWSRDLLELLLRTHADTLQHLNLSFLAGSLPMSLLKELSRLRFLKCWADNELFQLQALPNLEQVEIEDYIPGHPRMYSFCPEEEEIQEPPEQAVQTNYPGMVNFFRHSSHLRSVQLDFHYESPTAHLLALAESHSARILVTLRASWPASEKPGRVLEPMAASLHRFPNLRTLETMLETDAKCTDDFLRAVSPTSAPNLTQLGLCPARGECAHAWLHGPAVQDLLTRNPRLHLWVNDAGKSKICGGCAWCLWGCHLDPSRKFSIVCRAVFASHSKKAECPEDCLRLLPCTSCDPSTE